MQRCWICGRKNATGQGYAPRPDAEVDRLLFSHPYFSYKHTFIREEQGRAVAFTCGCVGDDVPRGKERGYFTCLVAKSSPGGTPRKLSRSVAECLGGFFPGRGQNGQRGDLFQPYAPAPGAARFAGA